MDVRYTVGKNEYKRMTTQELREAFLVDLNTNSSQLFLNEAIDHWRPTLEALPIRLVYEQSVLATYSFICSLTMRRTFCERLARCLFVPLFNDAENELGSFLLDEFFPALYEVAETEHFPIAKWQGIPLWTRTNVILASFVWSLLWQEEVIPVPSLIHRYTTWIGSWMARSVNALFNAIAGYTSPDEALSKRKNVYPGSQRCNQKSPHALWHQEAADVMYELTRLTDNVRTLLQEHQAKKQVNNNNWLQQPWKTTKNDDEDDVAGGRQLRR